MRILYECLDLSFPAGGVRRLYRHVEILRKHGFDARMLHHQEGFRTPWFHSEVPIDYWTNGYTFEPDDIVVIPEGHVVTMRLAQSLPCRRVIIALNWGNIFRNLKIGESWQQFGISAVIAGSLYERDFIKSTMGIESTAIVSGIDTQLFKPSPDKCCAIAYMPRKNFEYFHLIAAAFRSRFGSLGDVPFISIENTEHEKVAEVLSETAIFLAHTFPEGLSRKTLEAMACANIVVGFAGKGSLECMEDGVNCYMADDGDVLRCVDLLALAVQEFREGRAKSIQEAALMTARRYSLEREEEAVIKFWKEFDKSAN